MTKADTKDRDLAGLHQTSQVVDRLLAMGRVTRTIGDEDSVEVVCDFVDGVIVREDRNAGSPTDERAENVLLDTAVDDRNVHVATPGRNVEGGLGADLLHQVDLLRVDEGLVLIGVVLLSNGDSG